MNKAYLPLIALAGVLTSNAATIANSDPQAGGIGYTWTVNLESTTDSASVSGTVGAWSWEDQSLFDPGDPTVGWTHTSNWVALTLAEAGYVTITLEANSSVPYSGSGNIGGFAATSNFAPSFTLWSGWDNDGSDNHTYNNRGDVDWAEDISFIGLVDNTTFAPATYTVYLAAGNYTVALGSNAPSTSSPPRQGYSATFSVSSVPEPSVALLGSLALIHALRRRRK